MDAVNIRCDLGVLRLYVTLIEIRVLLLLYLPNLNFVALPVPEIIRGTGKIWAFPGYAHAPYTLKFLKDVCLHGPSEYACQI